MSVTTHLENAIEGAYREQLSSLAKQYFEHCFLSYVTNQDYEAFAEEVKKFYKGVELIDAAHAEIKKGNRGQT